MANGVGEDHQLENDKTSNQQQVPPSPATQAKKMLSAWDGTEKDEDMPCRGGAVEDEAVVAVEAVVGLLWQRQP